MTTCFLASVSTGQVQPDSPDRPSFILQPLGRYLQIATGSCRKPHDPGVDALSKTDDALAASYSRFDERLQVLLLTGDQIYADDVDRNTVLPAIAKLSQKLGLIEILPGGVTHTISYLNRKDIIEKAGFTSKEADGHLLSFGEFIAMYGLVWNPDNWVGTKVDGEMGGFVASLAKVRRLLANISTYMIFDDHDVTDDWFIHNNWKRDVLGKPLGKRLIANALAAYWLMQGWGNAPSRFDAKKAKKIIEARAANTQDAAAAQAFDSFFLAIEAGWEFATPTEPICYALDTRTQRGGGGFPPILKSADSWRATDIRIANKNLPFVLIAPAPLFTSATIDIVQKIYVTWSESRKLEKDFESWTANSESLFGLLDKLKSLQINKLVVLSGDVHYAYSAMFRIRDRAALLGNNGYTADGIQITASALKNGGMSAFDASFSTPSPYHLLLRRGSQEVDVVEGARIRVEPRRLIHVTPTQFQTAYTPFTPGEYPDFLITVTIGLGTPATAPLLPTHNFARLSIRQNDVSYRFNEGRIYRHSL